MFPMHPEQYLALIYGKISCVMIRNSIELVSPFQIYFYCSDKESALCKDEKTGKYSVFINTTRPNISSMENKTLLNKKILCYTTCTLNNTVCYSRENPPEERFVKSLSHSCCTIPKYTKEFLTKKHNAQTQTSLLYFDDIHFFDSPLSTSDFFGYYDAEHNFSGYPLKTLHAPFTYVVEYGYTNFTPSASHITTTELRKKKRKEHICSPATKQNPFNNTDKTESDETKNIIKKSLQNAVKCYWEAANNFAFAKDELLKHPETISLHKQKCILDCFENMFLAPDSLDFSLFELNKLISNL